MLSRPLRRLVRINNIKRSAAKARSGQPRLNRIWQPLRRGAGRRQHSRLPSRGPSLKGNRDGLCSTRSGKHSRHGPRRSRSHQPLGARVRPLQKLQRLPAIWHGAGFRPEGQASSAEASKDGRHGRRACRQTEPSWLRARGYPWIRCRAAALGWLENIHSTAQRTRPHQRCRGRRQSLSFCR